MQQLVDFFIRKDESDPLPGRCTDLALEALKIKTGEKLEVDNPRLFEEIDELPDCFIVEDDDTKYDLAQNIIQENLEIIYNPETQIVCRIHPLFLKFVLSWYQF